jgi:putative PEP-CTERM system TPR-repeat lipoprotein
MASIGTKIVSPANLRPMCILALLALVAAGCSKGEPTTDQILARANEALAAEQYDKAEKDFREVLRRTPADPMALRQLGIIYHDQGQIIQAYPLLKQAAELRPDDVDVQIKFGLTLLSLHEFTQARDAAQQVLDKQPANEQALLLLVDTATTPDEVTETRKFVEGLREKDQDRVSYRLAVGALDLRQKDEARAEGEFKTALGLDPKSSGAYSALGTLYWSRNDLKAADEALKAAADLSPQRSPLRLRYIDFKIRTGAVAEAKALVEDINRKAPDFLPPRVYLMKAACAERHEEDCAARVQNILAQDPINYDAVFLDGGLNLAKGDAPKAIREFEYLSNTYSRNPQVRYQLALAYLLQAKTANPVDSRNAVDNADGRLNEAIKLDPHFEQAILLSAELKIRKGSPAAAVELLAPLIKERPQTAQAHYLLASAYLAQLNAEQALAVYRQMTELFPKDPQPPFLLGDILSAQGKRPEARKAFEKSIEVSPDYLQAVERLVDLDTAEKQYAAAMDRARAQIQRNATLAQPFALRAKVYLAQQDIPHAEADLLKAVELDADLEPAYILLAQLYVSSNRQNLAISKLNAFVEKHKTVATLMQLATIHEQLKDFPAARDAYEKLLTVSGDFTPALNNLAVMYSEHLGRLDIAYDLAKKAREIAPNEPHMADTLGWILFKRGEYDNAVRPLREAASALADNPEIQFHVGMAEYMVGDEAPARVALQRAADGSTDFAGKDEARQHLALLAINAPTADSAARTQLENFLRERPNDPAAMVRLAQLQEHDGASNQAIKTYEKVLADSPLYAPAARQLTLLYGEHLADDPKAYDVALKAHQAYPEDAEITKALGILTYRRELYPRSAELLKEAATRREDDPELLYYLGATHHQLKQWNECKVALERAVTLKLSPAIADKAKQNLADCSEALPQ